MYRNIVASIFLLCVLCKGTGIVGRCRKGFFYQTLPLTVSQVARINLDSLFTGYNMQYELQQAQLYKQYLQLGDKLKLQKREIPDLPIIGLKNYHISKIGNSWGSSFIALSERRDRTYVHYGVVNSNTSAPVVNNYISVENFTNTTCYDAVLFTVENIIMVDCSVKLTEPNKKGQFIQNQFYYFRISDGKFIQTIKTEMYINFEYTQIRQLFIYDDVDRAHTFLLRSYFSDGVDPTHSDNTYVDVFMISDPYDPWIIEVIDRSYLQQSSLRISDVSVYLNFIYILDSKKGLHKIYINQQEDLEHVGFYEGKGFTKFGLYSSNLDNYLEVALARKDAIYQIDWIDTNLPKLINKYSLMPNSNILQVFLNDRFVFVRSNSVDGSRIYNYTWIFSRNDRTFNQAFQTIQHSSDSATFIDLNRDKSYLIILDAQQLSNYALDQAILKIKLSNDVKLLNKISYFTIKGISYDSVSNSSMNCSFRLNFTLLTEENQTLWPIGDAPSPHYTANYPGITSIKLKQYVLGPNITYSISQTSHKQLNYSKVFQQQQLSVSWNQSQSFQNITFLKTQIIQFSLTDIIGVYLQDQANIAYVSYCVPNHTQANIYCQLADQHLIDGQIKKLATTFFKSRYTHEIHHIAAYITDRHTNTIFISDISHRIRLDNLVLPTGYAGNITSIGAIGRFMFVVLKYIKSIEIYDLELYLEGIDEPVNVINHIKMYNLGVNYFDPSNIYTSNYHLNTIFIKTSQKIIFVDLSKEEVPKVLTTLNILPNSLKQFAFEVNKDSLLVTIPPTTIQQYDISRMNLGQIILLKNYPLYQHKLPSVHWLSVSDSGNLAYLTTTNDEGDNIIQIYRSGYPAVGTLYDCIDLHSYETIMLDVVGFKVDYVTVLSEEKLRIYRQYEEPVAEIGNPKVNFDFYLEFTNSKVISKLELIDVTIINLPTYITVNPFVQNIMNTKNLLYSGKNAISTINDSDWYYGNVLNIKSDCRDCPSKVRVINHIEREYVDQIIPRLTDYQWSQKGGLLQSSNAITHFSLNGSINKHVLFNDDTLYQCKTVTLAHHQVQKIRSQNYEVSGCISNEDVILYLVSLVSTNPFVFEPIPTEATYLLRLQSVHELIMLVDSSDNGFIKQQVGGIFLYCLNDDTDEEAQGLILIDYINTDDLGFDIGTDLAIVNADLSYHKQIDSYRLYVTELTYGIILIQFTFKFSESNIAISSVSILPVPKLLEEKGQRLPYDATYQAVILTTCQFDSLLKKFTESIVFTTGTFHTFQLSLQIDEVGSIISIYISRIYLRYAYYTVQNYIKYHDGFVIITQLLPEQYSSNQMSKQLMTVYNANNSDPSTWDNTSLIGSYIIDSKQLLNYDFNKSSSNQISWLSIISSTGQKLQKILLRRNLQVYTTQQVDTQIIYIDLINDFSIKKIRILINGISPFPQWEIIIIILFSIIALILLIIICKIGLSKYLIYRKQKNNDITDNYNQNKVEFSYDEHKISSPFRQSQNKQQLKSKQFQRYSTSKPIPKQQLPIPKYQAPRRSTIISDDDYIITS